MRINRLLIFFILAVTALAFASCQSKESAARRAILDYMEAGAPASGIRFKVLSLDVAPVTVADSVALLDAQFTERRDREVASQRQTLDYLRTLTVASGPGASVLDRVNAETGAAIERRIDSLLNAVQPHAARFAGRDGDEIIALRVGCKYGIIIPDAKEAKEGFDTFVLTPDASRVVRHLGKTMPAR